MKTDFQYIRFYPMPNANGRGRWECRNKKAGNELGQVLWYVHWRQFIYVPTTDAVYSTGCLRDICTFIESIKP